MNEDTHIYTTRAVAELIPTLWDEDARANPNIKPSDPEMPKGPSGDPSHKGDHMAHCADISRAWERAGLTLRQKQVLLLRYGMNFTQAEVAEHFGFLTHTTTLRHEERGIANLCNFLNGKREDYED